MTLDSRTLGRRVREVREAAGVTQDEARRVIGVSQPTYSRIETGDRTLKGDELVQLADRLGVRAAVLAGLPQVQDRACFAARTDGTSTPMADMRDHLYSYLELSSYLTDQGVPQA